MADVPRSQIALMAAYIDLRREAERSPPDGTDARFREGRDLERKRRAAELEAWRKVRR